MSGTAVVVIGVGVWGGIGLVSSFVMRRRGHDAFAWAVLGVAFGPLVVPLAIAHSRDELRAHTKTLHEGAARDGSVDVLVGLDGSAESRGALDAALRLLGPRIRRLTLATVIDYDAALADRGWGPEEDARDLLDTTLAAIEGHDPETIMLPGPPAEALLGHASEHGFDVLVVGARGRGMSKALLGSVAARLTRDATVPVLLGAKQVPASAGNGKAAGTPSRTG